MPVLPVPLPPARIVGLPRSGAHRFGSCRCPAPARLRVSNCVSTSAGIRAWRFCSNRPCCPTRRWSNARHRWSYPSTIHGLSLLPFKLKVRRHPAGARRRLSVIGAAPGGGRQPAPAARSLPDLRDAHRTPTIPQTTHLATFTAPAFQELSISDFSPYRPARSAPSTRPCRIAARARGAEEPAPRKAWRRSSDAQRAPGSAAVMCDAMTIAREDNAGLACRSIWIRGCCCLPPIH